MSLTEFTPRCYGYAYPPVSIAKNSGNGSEELLRISRLSVGLGFGAWWFSAEMAHNTNPKRKRGRHGRNFCPRLRFGLV